MRHFVLAMGFVVGLTSFGYGQVDIERIKEHGLREESRLAALKRGETVADRSRATWNALAEPTRSYEFFEAPLGEVAKRIAADHKIPILIDEAGLHEKKLASDTLINSNLKGITLQQALDWSLANHHLGWMVIDGYIVITTKERADTCPFQKIYSIRDLITSKSEQGMHTDYTEFVDLIRNTVAPSRWRAETCDRAAEDYTTLGSIGANKATGTIVVLQTHPVHRQIEALLELLRATRDGHEHAGKQE